MTQWSSTIQSFEVSGSQQETYNDDLGLMTASVQLQCAYTDRHALVADICGNRRAWPKGAAGIVPKAATASITPIETPGGSALGDELITYGRALVTINYTTKIVELASESIEPYSEFLTLPHYQFRMGSGGGRQLDEQEAPGRQMRGISFVRTDLDVSSPLSSSLIDLVGYVNSDSITWSLLGLTSPPDTLLYQPPQISYKIDSTNVIKYTVVKRFTYNPNKFNWYYDSRTAAWQQIYVQGASSPFLSYPSATFSGALL